MRPREAVLVVLVIFGLCRNAGAQGTSTLQSLKIPVGARASALGGAFVAVADEPSALFWNAAGLANVRSPHVVFSYNLWIMETSQRQFSVAFPAADLGTIAVGVIHFSIGEMPKIESYLNVGTYSAYDLAVSAGYAGWMTDAIALGVAGKFLHSVIAEYAASSWAVDAGALVRVGSLHFGLAARNLGPPMKYLEENEPLPGTVEVGVTYELPPVQLCAAVGKTNDRDDMWAAGLEVRPFPTVRLQAGYNSRYSASIGVRLRVGPAGFGYAFGAMREFSPVHWFSIAWGRW